MTADEKRAATIADRQARNEIAWLAVEAERLAAIQQRKNAEIAVATAVMHLNVHRQLAAKYYELQTVGKHLGKLKALRVAALQAEIALLEARLL